MRPSRALYPCISAVTLLAAGCAQQPLYTEPYLSVQPTPLATPQTLTLTLHYFKDGKRDVDQEQAMGKALAARIDAAGVFKVVPPSDGNLPRLQIEVNNASGDESQTLLGGLSASVGHVLVSQPEFTPQGRRSVRKLRAEISYTPYGGSAQSHVYTSRLITITNNTQEPTDLVPVKEPGSVELTLVGNDLDRFTADYSQAQTAPAH
jgi:hypothetical protein